MRAVVKKTIALILIAAGELAFTGAIVLFLGFAYFSFRDGGPFSYQFLGVLLLFLLLRRVKNILESDDPKSEASILEKLGRHFIFYFAGTTRTLSLCLLPILFFQMFIKTMAADGMAFAWEAESRIMALNLLFVRTNFQTYTGGLLIVILFLGLVVSVFSDRLRKYIALSFSTLAILNWSIFLLGFTFFTTVSVDNYEKVWRAERRAEITKSEDELRRELSEAILVQNFLLSKELQDEILKTLSAIITTSASFELIDKNVRSVVFNTLSNASLRIGFAQQIDASLIFSPYVSIDLDSKVANPKPIRDYQRDLGRAESNRHNENFSARRNIRELLTIGLQALIPELPDDMIGRATYGAVDAICYAHIELVDSSNRFARVIAFNAYLGVKELSNQNFSIPFLQDRMIQEIRTIDSTYISRVDLQNLDLVLNPPQHPISWESRLKGIGRAIIRAL